MRLLWIIAVSASFAACKTTKNNSKALDDGDAAGSETQTADGLWMENRPLVKQLDASTPLNGPAWTGPGGSEYWLYTENGGAGMNTFGESSTFNPYTSGVCSSENQVAAVKENGQWVSRCGCTKSEVSPTNPNEKLCQDYRLCEKAKTDGNQAGTDKYCVSTCSQTPSPGYATVNPFEYCEARPSELAKRCMRQAGDTLKAILAMNPPEYVDYLTRNRAPNYFGWIDDSGTFGGTGSSKGPFRWRTYMKWAGSVTADGTCTTGSLGQFVKQIKAFDQSGLFRLSN